MTQQQDRVRHLKAHIREFRIPIVRDGLILGKNARIGCIAIRRALHLLVDYPFIHIEPNDDVIGDILIREKILQRINEQQLTNYLMENIKPLMSADEIIQIDLDIEVELTR